MLSGSFTLPPSLPPTARNTHAHAQDFVIRMKIGSGSYGQVFQVMRKVDRNYYAMKVGRGGGGGVGGWGSARTCYHSQPQQQTWVHAVGAEALAG